MDPIKDGTEEGDVAADKEAEGDDGIEVSAGNVAGGNHASHQKSFELVPEKTNTERGENESSLKSQPCKDPTKVKGGTVAVKIEKNAFRPPLKPRRPLPSVVVKNAGMPKKARTTGY
ncbi:Aquaporin TIP4-1 [Senna tora]|uniref:Aquaporin TIP4-1 n=1 Tax=Senna tora TaxID=362788 RepID=A0A834SQV6_9FABA|nr:Aquaporin TIP4-1 [Senna tora]